jgi:hypothetical protein
LGLGLGVGARVVGVGARGHVFKVDGDEREEEPVEDEPGAGRAGRGARCGVRGAGCGVKAGWWWVRGEYTREGGCTAMRRTTARSHRGGN